MKLIDESKLRRLLIASKALARLKSGGVDNWEHYDQAMNDTSMFEKSYWKWLEEDLDKDIDNYQDVLDYDNYCIDIASASVAPRF